MQIHHRPLPILAFSLVFGAGLATATTIQTSSYSDWAKTLNTTPTESSMYIQNASYSSSSGWSTTIGSYGTFVTTGPDNGSYTLQGTTYGSNNLSALVGPSDGTGSTSSNGVLVTAPSAGITAGLLGIGITGSAATVTITLSDGETFTVNPTVNKTSFFGYSSSAPITSVFLTTTAGSAVVLDDVWAGVSNIPAATPTTPAAECATILLISGGLVFIGARRKIFSNFTAS